MGDEVTMLGFLPSPFGTRVKIALAEKGINYEYKEETLADKSPLLLKMNPVHKQIPVLIHNGKPISESLVVVQYIDEVWNNKSPLLPSDPYRRAQARFWTDFDKVYDSGSRVSMNNGKEQEKAKVELIECLKVMEGELGEKNYLEVRVWGMYVDVALVPFYACFYSYETIGKFSIGAECPKLIAWGEEMYGERKCFKVTF